MEKGFTNIFTPWKTWKLRTCDFFKIPDFIFLQFVLTACNIVPSTQKNKMTLYKGKERTASCYTINSFSSSYIGRSIK